MFWKGRGRTAAAPVVVPFEADRALVEAARHDPAAFEQLYRRYVAPIYSLALYETHDPHVAEDVTEAVFLRALSALPRFVERAEGEGSTFRVWLYAIARNVIANERRRERRHREDPLELALEVASADDTADVAASRLESRRALQAVLDLPPERRQAVLLRLVHELSAREIAQLMGKSEGAVRVLIHRGLSSVRQRLRA